MKLFLFNSLLIIVTAITFASDFPKNSIEVDPVNLALGGVYEIRYERSLNGMFGIYGEYGYRYKETVDEFLYEYPVGFWGGYDIAIGVRFYPSGKYRGFYVAGGFEYRYVELSGAGYYNEKSPNVKLGYKWLFFGHIPLSLGLGGSIPNQDWHVSEGTDLRKQVLAVRPTAEVMIGFSF